MCMNQTGSLQPRRSDFSQIDESVLYIVSAAFVALEICTTAKWMQEYNANKILPVVKYTKRRIWSKVMLIKTREYQHFKARGSYSHL